MDVDNHALAVDVAEFQLRSFGSPETGGIQQQQDRSISNVGSGRDQLLDLFWAEHNGKLLRHSGQLHVVQLGVVPSEDLLEKEMESGHAVLDGSGCQLLIPQHVQLELANFFDAQLVRRFMEVHGEVAYGADVVANGTGSKIAPLEFIQHALT